LGQEETAALQKRANVQGLLGAALSLAQGMSPVGPRRSAAQNILGAIAGGLQAGQGAYQGAIQNFKTQQELAQVAAQRQSIEMLLRDPRIANDPLKVAFVRSNPAEAIKTFSELLPIQEAISGGQVAQAAPMPAAMPSAGVAAPTGVAQGGEPILPATTVVGSRGADAQLLNQKNALIAANQRVSNLPIPSKLAQDRIKSNLDVIASIDKELDRSAVSGFDFVAIENAVPQQFRGRVRSLRAAADTGAISMSDLTQRLQDIEKDAVAFVTKKTDYTNQDRRVAAGMFQGRPIEELNPDELMQLQNKLDEMDIQKRRAGAQSLTVQMPTESERTAGFLTNRVVNSLNQLQTVVGASPTAASPNFSAEAVKFLTRSDYLKNLANPETRQQVEAAQLDILDAALTLGTGAAYTREQLENYRNTYFPQLGDKPANIKDKQARLQSLLDSAMIKSGRSAPSVPSSFSPMFDMNAIEAELNRRKGK
jgi:hypothetical protein